MKFSNLSTDNIPRVCRFSQVPHVPNVHRVVHGTGGKPVRVEMVPVQVGDVPRVRFTRGYHLNGVRVDVVDFKQLAALEMCFNHHIHSNRHEKIKPQLPAVCNCQPGDKTGHSSHRPCGFSGDTWTWPSRDPMRQLWPHISYWRI